MNLWLLGNITIRSLFVAIGSMAPCPPNYALGQRVASLYSSLQTGRAAEAKRMATSLNCVNAKVRP